MGKRLPHTPVSKIKNYIRMCWERSRERAKVLKDNGYCCAECGKKQSRARGKEVYVQVHHISLINWERIIRVIREEILDKPQIPLCKACHLELHDKKKSVG